MTNYIDTIDRYIDVTKVGDIASLSESLKKLSREKWDEIEVELRKSLPNPKASTSNFNFIANTDLSGLPLSCGEYSCRLKKLKCMAAFASIYADQVVLFNPFEYIHSDGISKGYKDFNELCFAIMSIIILRPLIDQGIVTFMSYDTPNFCPKCFSNLLVSHSYGGKKADIYRDIYDDIISNCDTRISEIENGKILIEIESYSDLFEHEKTYKIISRNSERLRENDIDLSIGKKLSRKEIHALKLFQNVTSLRVADLATKYKAVTEIGSGNIFSSSPEMKLINQMFNRSFEKKEFEAEIPFLYSSKFEDILSMRSNEWHHFENFREKFFSVINNVDVDETDITKLYRSDILPEMIKIKRIFEKSQDTSKKALIQGAGIAAFSMSASLLTSGISGLVSSAAAVLGAGHFTKNALLAMEQRIVDPEEAKDSNFYYAWKVKERLEN